MFSDEDNGTTEITSGEHEIIQSALSWAEEEMEFIEVRPYAETRGADAGSALLRDIHKKPLRGTMSGRVPTMTFGMIYQDDIIRYVFGIKPPTTESTGIDHLISPITTRYEESEVSRVNSSDSFIPINTGDHAIGASMEMVRHCCFPTSTFDSKKDRIEGDTHAAFVPAMVGDHSTDRSMLQVTFRPISSRWFGSGLQWQGMGDGRIKAEYRKKGEFVGGFTNPHVHEDPTSHMAAKEIEEQRGEKAYQATIDVIAVSEDQQAALQRINEMRDMFSDIDSSINDQELEATILNGVDLYDAIDRMIRRIIPPQGTLSRRIKGPNRVFTYNQLADGFVHLPTREGKDSMTVNGTYVDYSEMESGQGVPASSPTPPEELVGSTD